MKKCLVIFTLIKVIGGIADAQSYVNLGYGDYFARGEIATESDYICSNYKYANGDYN